MNPSDQPPPERVVPPPLPPQAQVQPRPVLPVEPVSSGAPPWGTYPPQAPLYPQQNWVTPLPPAGNAGATWVILALVVVVVLAAASGGMFLALHRRPAPVRVAASPRLPGAARP